MLNKIHIFLKKQAGQTLHLHGPASLTNPIPGRADLSL